jgi:hypothetical protein
MATAKNNKPAGFREFERNNADVGRQENLKVPLNRIVKKPGFNPRDLDKPETQAKIQAIKSSYIAGRYVPAIEVTMEDEGHVSIVNGECRYTAALLAHEEMVKAGGEGIPFLVVVPFKGNDADRLLLTITSNEGEKLTQIEKSEVIKRFIGQGFKKTQIVEMTSFSASYVDKLDFLSNMPHQIKVWVQADRISADVAIEACKKSANDDEAIAKLQALIDKADGKKVSAKDTKTKSEPSGDGEGDGEGGEGSGPKPKKIPTKKVLEMTKELAFQLPEVITDRVALKDDKEYPIRLNGKAINLLRDLQDTYTDAHAPANAETPAEGGGDGEAEGEGE